jgi:hypothetical protein
MDLRLGTGDYDLDDEQPTLMLKTITITLIFYFKNVIYDDMLFTMCNKSYSQINQKHVFDD